MSTTKWRTGWANHRDNLIEPVTCLKETRCYVWIEFKDSRGRLREYRMSKAASGSRIHNTWEEAYDYLLEQADHEVSHHRALLAQSERKLLSIQALIKPAMEEVAE